MLSLSLTSDDPIEVGSAMTHLIRVNGNQVRIGIERNIDTETCECCAGQVKLIASL